eukprot:10864433-Alexandrium_andersonii.AAC.1
MSCIGRFTPQPTHVFIRCAFWNSTEAAPHQLIEFVVMARKRRWLAQGHVVKVHLRGGPRNWEFNAVWTNGFPSGSRRLGVTVPS